MQIYVSCTTPSAHPSRPIAAPFRRLGPRGAGGHNGIRAGAHRRHVGAGTAGACGKRRLVLTDYMCCNARKGKVFLMAYGLWLLQPARAMDIHALDAGI